MPCRRTRCRARTPRNRPLRAAPDKRQRPPKPLVAACSRAHPVPQTATKPRTAPLARCARARAPVSLSSLKHQVSRGATRAPPQPVVLAQPPHANTPRPQAGAGSTTTPSCPLDTAASVMFHRSLCARVAGEAPQSRPTPTPRPTSPTSPRRAATAAPMRHPPPPRNRTPPQPPNTRASPAPTPAPCGTARRGCRPGCACPPRR